MHSMRKALATVAVAATLTTGGLVTAAVPAEAAVRTVALCNGYQYGSKDPTLCRGLYRLYDVSSSSNYPRVIAQIDNNNYAYNRYRVWRSIRLGYESAQTICARNSLTCGILTSVAMTLLAPLIAPARS